LRGHGESDWSPSGDYALATHARDVLTVLKERSPPIALVGASLGGLTALRAVADGFRPAALVLVDIVPRPDPQGVVRIREFMLRYPQGFATLDEVADAVAAYNPHRPRSSDANGLLKNLRLKEDGRLYWHWDPRIIGRSLEQVSAEFEKTFQGLKTLQGSKGAQDLPVQLVRGLKSEIVTERGLAELRDALPTLEVFDVPAAGHMVAGDSNDAFNQGVIDFLTRRLS
jgi:pimeloyl-ACP methyl ester carboxylesterase